MKKLLSTSFALFISVVSALGWGEKGHNATAHIAQKHLSCRAKKEISRLLGGRSMAYWSSWADGLRSDDRFDFISTWHYANADEGYTYQTAPKAPTGDVYTAVEECVRQLQAKGQSDSLRAMYLKLLIHFVGDMHCPMHAGHASDRGGNGHKVEFRGRSTNLHSLWDSALIDAAHGWSAQEWAENIDHRKPRRERRELAAGTPLMWMEETVVLSHSIYAATLRDAALPRDYVHTFAPLIEEQLLEGGYRLAALLNEIF